MLDELQRDLTKDLKDPEFAKSYGVECARSEFGLTIFHARQEVKLTQKELADKFGVSQPYIAQLESGEVNLTSDVLGKMLAVLGFKVSAKLELLAPQEKPSLADAVFFGQRFLSTGYDVDLMNAAASGVTVQNERVYILNTHTFPPGSEITIIEPRLIRNPPKVDQSEPIRTAA